MGEDGDQWGISPGNWGRLGYMGDDWDEWGKTGIHEDDCDEWRTIRMNGERLG